MALSDKSKRLVMIISLGEVIDYEPFFERLVNVGFPALGVVEFAYILHSLDVKDDGSFKTPHLHIYMETKTGKRIGTQINAMAKAMDISSLAISAEVCASVEGAIQYMIHKNDPDKHQYARADIVSNIDRSELDLILDRPSQAFSVDYIINCWKTCERFSDFVKAIGIDRYTKYRNLIRDLINGERG